MKKLLFFILAFSISITSFLPTASASSFFTDTNSSQMKFFIEELGKNKVVTGYADGTFRPKEKVTRAQYAKMLVLALELPLDANYAKQFKDVGDWARPYVGALVREGITKGKSNTIFGASSYITRQEMAVMFVRAMGLEEMVLLLDYRENFADFYNVSSWAQPHVSFLRDIDFIQGNGDYYFPQEASSREAFAKLTYRLKYEDKKFLERGLNRIIREFYEDATYVSYFGDNLIEISYTNGEFIQYELGDVFNDIYWNANYYDLAYLDGFDWNALNSTERKELLNFVIQYWDSGYSEYQLLKSPEQTYNILLGRLNNYYVNSTNNRDDFLTSVQWAAIDTYTIEYIGEEQ